MPKITGVLEEVLADPENAVLGDVMTVEGPKPVKGGPRRKRRSRPYYPQLADDLGLFDMGISRALMPYKPVALAAPEDDKDELARLLVVPQGIVGGAIKGGLYGALLGNGSAERRIGGGALGGAVAFPALTAIANKVKSKLASGGGQHPIANALVDDAAHVGGATVSVVAAGGEAEDGAIAGTVVVAARHVLDWIVGR